MKARARIRIKIRVNVWVRVRVRVTCPLSCSNMSTKDEFKSDHTKLSLRVVGLG